TAPKRCVSAWQLEALTTAPASARLNPSPRAAVTCQACFERITKGQHSSRRAALYRGRGSARSLGLVPDDEGHAGGAAAADIQRGESARALDLIVARRPRHLLVGV